MTEQSGKLGEKFGKALQLTYQLFGKDQRKGGEIPYIAHLLSVCSMVLYDGGDEDEAIAALLHDVLEEKPELVSREKLLDEFGSRVLAIIEVSTDTPVDYEGGIKPPWKQRKLNYLQKVAESDPKLLRVTVADKVDNACAILGDYGTVGNLLWDRFKGGKSEIQWYYRASIEAYRQTGMVSSLLERLSDAVKRLKRL